MPFDPPIASLAFTESTDFWIVVKRENEARAREMIVNAIRLSDLDRFYGLDTAPVPFLVPGLEPAPTSSGLGGAPFVHLSFHQGFR